MVPIFDGFLALGGNEVLNSARAVGYTSTAPCQVSWLTVPPCEGVADAVDDEPYTFDTLAAAPWYDEDDEPTHRFLGAHAVLIEGLVDSTRTAEVSEGLTDGGVVGRVRHATKRIRVRAMLTAQGQDALAAGFAWLDAVLRPDACGMHGTGCGASDAAFFAACPPTRTSVVSPSGLVWAPMQRNLLRRPRPNSWDLVGLSGAVVDDYAQLTVTAPGEQYVDLTTLGTRINVDNHHITYQAEVRLGPTTAAAVLRLLWLDVDGNFIVAGTQDGEPTVSKDWQRITVTAPPPPGAVKAGVFLLLASNQPLGATADVRHVMAQRTRNVNPYFDGDSVTTDPMQRFRWDGPENASQSVAEYAEEVLSPDEVAYQQIVDQLERTMHNVTCVSGPTIEETLHRGDVWGYVVEFVLVAATPWIFTNPRAIQLPPTLPVIVQDLVYNLVPHPSAELAAGAVVVATNHTANPSVETNATGWVAGSTGVIASDVSGARSTLAASEGSASFRTHFTASNSGTGGTLIVENNSTTYPAAVIGDRMSVNMWAAATVTAGTAVLGATQIYAVWRTGTTTVRTDLIGAATTAVPTISKTLLAPPVGSTNVLVRAITTLTSWSSGAIVDVYGDAVAVTAP